MRQFPLPSTVDALLVSHHRNIYYLTEFSSHSEDDREVFLLITPDKVYLFTYRLYEQEAYAIKKQYKKALEVVFLSKEHPLRVALKQLAEEHSIKKLGIEATSLRVHEYNRIAEALPMVTIIPEPTWIEPKRMIKDQQEIAILTRACQVTDECFAAITPLIVPGISEKALAWEIERWLREHNATNSFAPVVAVTANASRPHHTPTDTKVEDPSLVLIDFGAKIDGYHADMTRVVFVGIPKPAWKKAYEAVLAAQTAALSYLQTTPAATGQEADRRARQVLIDAGYPTYPHGLGHGVGLSIHEEPRLHEQVEQALLPGMVFSIEPGLYLPGEFGIRIEDLVLKTETGITILSHSPKELS